MALRSNNRLVPLTVTPEGGAEVEVDFTTDDVYTSQAGTSTATLPDTINAATTYWVREIDLNTESVFVTMDGTEIRRDTLRSLFLGRVGTLNVTRSDVNLAEEQDTLAGALLNGGGVEIDYADSAVEIAFNNQITFGTEEVDELLRISIPVLTRPCYIYAQDLLVRSTNPSTGSTADIFLGIYDADNLPALQALSFTRVENIPSSGVLSQGLKIPAIVHRLPAGTAASDYVLGGGIVAGSGTTCELVANAGLSKPKLYAVTA
jgi:hypothetical protein